MIAIIDYGAGNLRSVQNTLDAVGAQYAVVQQAEAVEQASKIILPGVGHFGQMMRALEEKKLRGVLVRTPFSGPCVEANIAPCFRCRKTGPDERIVHFS